MDRKAEGSNTGIVALVVILVLVLLVAAGFLFGWWPGYGVHQTVVNQPPDKVTVVNPPGPQPPDNVVVNQPEPQPPNQVTVVNQPEPQPPSEVNVNNTVVTQ